MTVKTTILMAIFAIQITGHIFCQTEDRTICYSEFEDLIKESNNYIIKLSNYIIELDYTKDKKYQIIEKITESSGRMSFLMKYELDSLIFPNKRLQLFNCVFKSPPAFVHWNFVELMINGCEAEGFIRINNCKFNRVSIAYSTFENLAINNSEIEFPEYRNGIGFNMYDVQCNGNLNIESNNFTKNSNFDNTIRPELKKSKQLLGDSFLEELNPLVTIHNCNLKNVFIRENTFFRNTIATDTLVSFGLIGTKLNSITISNSTIPSLDLDHTTILQSTEFDSVFITDFISLNKFDYRGDMFNVSWSLLENANICLRKSGKNYYGKTDAELSEVVDYNDLMGTYVKLVNSYRDRGDIESANKCYVALKDLDTGRKKYLYDKYGGGTNYLNYRMNTFLKFFALYGTSPIRSIQISWRVILIFAGIYFFFYSSWDKINGKYLVMKGNSLISYFNSEKSLEDFFHIKYKDEISSYEDLKEKIKTNKTKVPFFFNIFLKPLYWFVVTKFKFYLAIYSRIEFLKGTWSNLTITRKTVVGFLTFMYIVMFISYLIVFRGLNSIILSLNAFVTLGFGEIPVSGISKYLAIVEGTLGWILLSIFSVTLLSQIMQI